MFFLPDIEDDATAASVTQRATQHNEESSSNTILTVEKSRLLLSSVFNPKRKHFFQKPRY